MAMQCCCACMQGGGNHAEKSAAKKKAGADNTPQHHKEMEQNWQVARATRRPQGTRTAWEAAQEWGAGAGGEGPVLGAQNGPRMDEDPVGPRHRVAGGPVGYKHGMRDGMGPGNNPGD